MVRVHDRLDSETRCQYILFEPPLRSKVLSRSQNNNGLLPKKYSAMRVLSYWYSHWSWFWASTEIIVYIVYVIGWHTGCQLHRQCTLSCCNFCTLYNLFILSSCIFWRFYHPPPALWQAPPPLCSGAPPSPRPRSLPEHWLRCGTWQYSFTRGWFHYISFQKLFSPK